MRKITFVLFAISLFFTSVQSYAQITNLLVNGSSTHFTMASGSEVSWSYNLPVGGTATLEFWLDVNGNQSVDPLTDVLWTSFYQIDGESYIDGPPDMDGLVNGHIEFAQPVGLAPYDYVMVFGNNGSSVSISGTVIPLASPVFTVSGSVSVPIGKSAQYLVMNLSQGGDGGKFWSAVTDAAGNFSIQMDGDTTGNPWRLRVDNANLLDPAVAVPDRIEITLNSSVGTNYSGNNITFYAASAEVNGTVKDEDGNPLSGMDVYLSKWDQSFQRNTQTDITGHYRIGLINSELPMSNVGLGSGNSEDNNIFAASVQIPSIISGNVITKNLVIYKTNATISGNVKLMGNSPNMTLVMSAYLTDVGQTRAYADFNGNYTLHVTDKLSNYQVGPDYLPYPYEPYTIIAQPGQNNVDFNFNPTDVENDEFGIPNEFALKQNFPNPFNPNTVIRYDIKENELVQLKVYNILGNEIASLVNEVKPAGRYNVEFIANGLTSGIYFYKLQAGSFSETKKMLLLK